MKIQHHQLRISLSNARYFKVVKVSLELLMDFFTNLVHRYFGNNENNPENIFNKQTGLG